MNTDLLTAAEAKQLAALNRKALRAMAKGWHTMSAAEIAAHDVLWRKAKGL